MANCECFTKPFNKVLDKRDFFEALSEAKEVAYLDINAFFLGLRSFLNLSEAKIKGSEYYKGA